MGREAARAADRGLTVRMTSGLLWAAVSVGLFLLPAGIWNVVTGFEKTLLEFLALIFTFSVVPFDALLDPRLPEWLAVPPGIYILNVFPVLITSLVAFLILRKSTQLSRVKALCIAGNASLLLLQVVGSLMLYFFITHSGPYGTPANWAAAAAIFVIWIGIAALPVALLVRVLRS